MASPSTQWQAKSIDIHGAVVVNALSLSDTSGELMRDARPGQDRTGHLASLVCRTVSSASLRSHCLARSAAYGGSTAGAKPHHRRLLVDFQCQLGSEHLGLHDWGHVQPRSMLWPSLTPANPLRVRGESGRFWTLLHMASDQIASRDPVPVSGERDVEEQPVQTCR